MALEAPQLLLSLDKIGACRPNIGRAHRRLRCPSGSASRRGCDGWPHRDAARFEGLSITAAWVSNVVLESRTGNACAWTAVVHARALLEGLDLATSTHASTRYAGRVPDSRKRRTRSRFASDYPCG